MRFIARVAVAATVGLALVPAAASATKYSGSCPDIAGTATFGKPLTSTEEKNTYDFTGTAKCTGTIDGKAIKDEPVAIHVAGDGQMSCSSGKSITPGKGTITIKSTGVVIGFTMTFDATLTEVDLVLKGLKSGTGKGHASFFNQSDPSANLTTVQNCGADGNKKLSFTASSQTDEGQSFDDGQTATTTETSGGGTTTDTGGNGTNNTANSSNPDTTTSSEPGAKSQPDKKKPNKKSKKKKSKSKKKKSKSKKSKSKKGKKKKH